MERKRDEILDLIRGMSAIIVLMGHARNFLMVDSAEVTNPNFLSKAFYLVTSFHHEAVMVFFVLSGYFVGGSVLGALAKARFTWTNYALARLSRLWVVVVPALFLTFFLDLAGSKSFPAAYTGALNPMFNSGPLPSAPAEHGIVPFIGNLVFLQKILVPVYGTNGPLWSLAFEFWYYVLFPLAACAIWPRRIFGGAKTRIASVLLMGLLLLALPKLLLGYGVIWLMGVAAWIGCQRGSLTRWRNHLLWKVCGASLFAVVLIGCKAGKIPYGDYIIGASFALWLPSLIGNWPRIGWWSKVSAGLSEISFSLYIIHFPIMFAIVTVALKGSPFQPSLEGLAWFGSINLVCLLIAALFWWAFESRTDRVRGRVKMILTKSLSPQPGASN